MREQDREKFVRLANNRVNRAIKDIRLIGNLANRSNYSYTEEDVRKILRALEAEVKVCRQRFDQSGPAQKRPFRLE